MLTLYRQANKYYITGEGRCAEGPGSGAAPQVGRGRYIGCYRCAVGLLLEPMRKTGFAERKVLLCQDVLRLVRKTHGELAASSTTPWRGAKACNTALQRSQKCRFRVRGPKWAFRVASGHLAVFLMLQGTLMHGFRNTSTRRIPEQGFGSYFGEPNMPN